MHCLMYKLMEVILLTINVEIASGLSGIMTAALVACRSITDCSGPSNVVVFDRTAPNAPMSLWYNSR